jgi:hypothetical protein
MNGQTDGLTDGLTDRLTDGRTDVNRTTELTNKRKNEKKVALLFYRWHKCRFLLKVAQTSSYNRWQKSRYHRWDKRCSGRNVVVAKTAVAKKLRHRLHVLDPIVT